MKKTKHRGHSRINDALRLQRGLYDSRNPTRRWLHNSRLQWLNAAVTRYVSVVPCGPAVDLGTGSGVLLPILSLHFRSVISVDIEPAFLRYLKEVPIEKGNTQYMAGNARSLPIRGDAAGLIVCSEVLEHIQDETACLNEIYRILKPGGILILSTPQPFSLLELTAGIFLRRPVIPFTKKIYREPVLPTGHINLVANRKLESKLAQSGFTILETHKSGLYLPGLAEIPARWPQKMLARLNNGLTGTRLDFLLWTQFFVARKKRL